MKKLQSGRSMVEMLGVLAIIGVLSVGGLAGYSMGMARYRVNRTISDVQLLLTNVRTLYANQDSYAGLDNTVLKSMGILDNTAKNLFGGTITVAPKTVTNANDGFTVELKGIPKKACISIISSDWGTANDGLKSIKAGANEKKVFPVSVQDAPGACTDDPVDMTWTYQ